MDRDFIINNLAVGVYTNTDKYMSRFIKNWNKYYANVPLIYSVKDQKINENMESLRKEFIETGKRYWLFLDHDILFFENDIIETSLKYMIEKDCQLISCYETHDINIAKKNLIHNLNFTYLTWIKGYFMMVDSEKCLLTPFDLNIPTTSGNLADLTYCMDNIVQNNVLIGIAPVMIYHEKDGYSQLPKKFVINNENSEIVNKNVNEYLHNLDPKYYYGNRNIEIVFFGDGSIDHNETIGHQYLKYKHPEIHNKVYVRPHYNSDHIKDEFNTKLK